MKKPVVVDATDLLNSAQQLEARSDPLFVAQELRAIVAAAKPAPDADLHDEMKTEIRSFDQCRGPVHGDPKKACDCRCCRIMKRIGT